MAGEITTTYAQTGQTIYFLIFNQAEQVWRDGIGFENYNASHWLEYAFPMVETDPNRYFGDFPQLIGLGLYYVTGYLQSGISPNNTDIPILLGGVDWDGSRESTIAGESAEKEYSITTGRGTSKDYKITVTKGNNESNITTGVR